MQRGRWMLEGGAETTGAARTRLQVRERLLQDKIQSSEWVMTALDRLE